MANALVRQDAMSNEAVELIKATIAKGATDSELKLFLYQCERTGLDPLAKQIYSIKRAGKMVTQIGIDGARLVAQRSGRYAGQDGPYWCGEDGQWTDVWLSDNAPRAAKVNVYLMGVDRGTPGVAHWREYAQTSSDMWRKMPALMLAKCAEMLALRKAFPQELSGLYTAEEMSQADNVIEVTGREIESATGEIVDTQAAPATASQAQLERMEEIGLEYYKEKWPANIKKWVDWASKGSVSDAKELLPQEVEDIIACIEKRMADAVAKAAATNGDVVFGK